MTHSFRYEFVVPVAALPADGLKLDLLDDDGRVGPPELIGSMRISRAKLIEAYQSASKMLVLSGIQWGRRRLVKDTIYKSAGEQE